MKAVVPYILKRYGFKRTLVVNSIISAAFVAACALFTPSMPAIVIMAVLIASGFFRSLQFTSINTIVYAEIDRPRMSRATSLVSVAQQLSVTTGVAVGALGVEMAMLHSGNGVITAADFPPAFILVALISAVSILFFLRLEPNAGEELANRTPGPTEGADQRIG